MRIKVVNIIIKKSYSYFVVVVCCTFFIFYADNRRERPPKPSVDCGTRAELSYFKSLCLGAIRDAVSDWINGKQ